MERRLLEMTRLNRLILTVLYPVIPLSCGDRLVREETLLDSGYWIEDKLL